MNEISTTIITSMHNREKNVLEVIDNLFFPSLLNNGNKNTELIIIDDFSPLKEETEAIIEKYLINLKNVFDSVVIKRNESNLGFAKSFNSGINIAKGKYLLVTNDDVYFPIDSIKKLVNTLSEPENYKIIGPISNSTTWSFQYCKQAPTLKSFSTNEKEKLESFYVWLVKKMAGKRMPTSNISGFCFAADAVFLREFNGFNENYKYGYFEDTDLFNRINKKYGNAKTAVNMEVFISHGGIGNHPSTSTKQQPIKLFYYFLINALKYGKEWGYVTLIKRITSGLSEGQSGKGTISELLPKKIQL